MCSQHHGGDIMIKDVDLMNASVYMECGELAEAEKLLDEYAACSAASRDSAARVLKAQLALKQGNFAAAETLLRSMSSDSDDIMDQQRQVLQQQLQAVKPLFDAAEEALLTKSWQMARQLAQNCLNCIQPSSMPGLATKALQIQATASAELQECGKALQALDQALQLQPKCKPALWQRAAGHSAAGNHQAAFSDLRRLSALQPDYPGLLVALQEAARACSEQRRAAVHAAAPPPRRYSRITKRGNSPTTSNSTDMCGKSRAQIKLYEVLELDPAASTKEIRQAYKRLATKLHPDKQATASTEEKQGAEERFKAVSAAYQALVM